MKTFKKVLIATDLSDYSTAAFKYLEPLRGLYKAHITVLYVLDVVPQFGFPAVGAGVVTAMRDPEPEARESVRELVDRVIPGIPVDIAIRYGSPYEEIVRFATEEKIDLICMSTHGRTGISHALLGSVAEKVVRHSPVPVLTVKPDTAGQASSSEEEESKPRRADS